MLPETIPNTIQPKIMGHVLFRLKNELHKQKKPELVIVRIHPPIPVKRNSQSSFHVETWKEEHRKILLTCTDEGVEQSVELSIEESIDNDFVYLMLKRSKILAAFTFKKTVHV